MDIYLEQTVTAPQKAGNRIAGIAAWVLLAVLAIIGLVSLTSVLSINEEGGLKFDFVSLIIVAIAAGLGFLVYRGKDKLNTEYDYILSGETLEVFGIYAEKRRKKLMSINVREISDVGYASGNKDYAKNEGQALKKRSFVLNEDADVYFICSRSKNERVVAFLELNEEMRSQIKKMLGGRYGAIGGGF